MPEDKIVQAVKQMFDQRADVGFAKYGTNLERQDLCFADWIQHLQHELMDAILYCEKLKTDYNGPE